LEDTVVGVNKYRLEIQERVEVLQIDNTKVRESQIARLNSVKQSRDQKAVDAALKALAEAATAAAGASKETNLLKCAVDAARVRATLGEISAALEAKWGRHGE
jgi:methylmalonyl-CoA mutase